MRGECCIDMRMHSVSDGDPRMAEFEEPETLIYHSPDNHLSGIIVHDGSSRAQQIHFCPFCGTDLAGGAS